MKGEQIMQGPDILSGVEMPHPHHEEHLCLLQNIGYLKSHLEQYKKLVKDPKFICKGCGRVAAQERHLCAPEKL
jgi:hypothetical protein